MDLPPLSIEAQRAAVDFHQRGIQQAETRRVETSGHWDRSWQSFSLIDRVEE